MAGVVAGRVHARAPHCCGRRGRRGDVMHKCWDPATCPIIHRSRVLRTHPCCTSRVQRWRRYPWGWRSSRMRWNSVRTLHSSGHVCVSRSHMERMVKVVDVMQGWGAVMIVDRLVNHRRRYVWRGRDRRGRERRNDRSRDCTASTCCTSVAAAADGRRRMLVRPWSRVRLPGVACVRA